MLLCALAAAAEPARVEVETRITYLAPDGFFVDAGKEQGLRVDDAGIVRRGAREIARAQVVAVSATSARLRTLRRSGDERPRVGDRVRFVLPRRAAPAEPEDRSKRPESGEPFVPLLDKQKRLAKARSRENVSHGFLELRQVAQSASRSAFDYWRTTLASAGSIERLGGRRWALRWSGNLSGRGGDSFMDSTLEGARLDVFELSLSMPLGDDGLLKLGRLLPTALPAAGYLDGALAEKPFSDRVRGGAAFGFRPQRDELTPYTDEPAALAYATFATKSYTATTGVFAALFEGDLDRLAVLTEQHLALGAGFRAHLSLEIDVDVDAAVVRSGTRLTRADFYATRQVSRSVAVRAGFDHYENLDNRSEREAIGADPALFDRGVWRYWAGARIRLPADLDLDVEITSRNAPDAADDLLWTATLTRLLARAHLTVSLTVHNLEGTGLSGVGGHVTAYWTPGQGRWTLHASAAFQMVDEIGDLDVTHFRLLAEHRLDDHWSVRVGGAFLVGEVDAVTIDAALRYRW